MTYSIFEEHFKIYLKENNLKFTKERKDVLKAVDNQQNHFHVEDIYKQVRKQKSNVSLATIYRTIPLLTGSGLIVETLYGGEKGIYEKTYNKPHHHHMVCSKCGLIIEFTCQDLEEIQNNICDEHNFLSTEYRLEIKGYCDSCKKEIKNGNKL